MQESIIQHLSPSGQLSEEKKHSLTDEIALRGYQVMLQTRLVDERMITLQRQGQITFAMSSLGEEAAAVATTAALQEGDWIFPQYREQGCMFWRGFSIEDYLHHMWGNCHDLNKGRQMPNHFGSKKLNVFTVSSPLATQLPQAAGTAWAMKMQKEPNVTLAFFGEGTASKEDFACALNFAAVKKAPVIYLCRNNGYAISTPTNEQFATSGIAEKGPAFGLKSFRVDGNDFFALYEVVQHARNLCLKEGPVLIEAMTYRMGAHSTSDDPSCYRDESEVEKWREKDPLTRLKKFLLQKNLWDEKKEKEYIQSIHKEIDQAIEKARSAPPPSFSTLQEDTFFAPTQEIQDQVAKTRSLFSEPSSV